MKLRQNCRQVTRLVLEGLDRDLPWSERLVVRLHMLICKACPRFQQQAQFMRAAMGRWKAYAEGDAPPR